MRKKASWTCLKAFFTGVKMFIWSPMGRSFSLGKKTSRFSWRVIDWSSPKVSKAWVTPKISRSSSRSPTSPRSSTDIPHPSPLHESNWTEANDDSLENWVLFHHWLSRRLVVSWTAIAEYSVRKMADRNDFDNRWDCPKLQFILSLRRWTSCERKSDHQGWIRDKQKVLSAWNLIRWDDLVLHCSLTWLGSIDSCQHWREEIDGPKWHWRQFISDHRRTNNSGWTDWNVAFSAQRSSSTYLDENLRPLWSITFSFLFSEKWINFQLKSIETMRSKMTSSVLHRASPQLHHSVRCHGTSDGWD